MKTSRPTYTLPRTRPQTSDDLRERRIMAHYHKTHAVPLVAEEVFAAIAGRFGYLVNDDWRRARCAGLAAACLELELVNRSLGGTRARRLVCERFNRLPLGNDATGAPRKLALTPLTLWRAMSRWRRAEGASPAVFTMQTANCGRRPIE